MKRFYLLVSLMVALCGNSALAKTLSCENLAYGNNQYFENMDALAKEAKMSNGWDRNHESFVSDLCKGDTKEINRMVDDGYVTPKDAASIAKILGKNYVAPKRSEAGKTYEHLNYSLRDLGLCSACASNVASVSVKNPDSKLAQLANAAIAGDKAALEELQAANTSTENFSADLLAAPANPVVKAATAGGLVVLYLGIILGLGWGLYKGKFKTLTATQKNLGYAAIVAVIILPIIMSGEDSKKSPQEKSCEEDWKQCSDNEQLANNYKKWSYISASCKTAASKMAKFGKPDFPWMAFGTFHTGRSYIDSGIAYAIENEAKFQNAFGTTVNNTRVICEYDLKTDKVLNVLVE